MNARLKPPTPLPEQESSANNAWRVGFWQGLSIGVVLTVATAVVLVKTLRG